MLNLAFTSETDVGLSSSVRKNMHMHLGKNRAQHSSSGLQPSVT